MAGAGFEFHDDRIHVARLLRGQAGEVRRVGVTGEVKIAGAVESDAVAVVGPRASEVGEQSESSGEHHSESLS